MLQVKFSRKQTMRQSLECKLIEGSNCGRGGEEAELSRGRGPTATRSDSLTRPQESSGATVTFRIALLWDKTNEPQHLCLHQSLDMNCPWKDTRLGEAAMQLRQSFNR